jgi:hypothetical protein
MRSFAKFSVLSWKLKYSRPDFAQGKPAFGVEPFDSFKDAEFKGGNEVERRLAPPTSLAPRAAISSIQREEPVQFGTPSVPNGTL